MPSLHTQDLVCRIGDIDIASAVLRARIDPSGADSRGSAKVVVRSEHSALIGVDFIAPVVVERKVETGVERLFTGGIVAVSHRDGTSVIECEGGLLTVNRPSPYICQDSCHLDMGYSLVAGCGVREISIFGLEDLPVEDFNVFVPVVGVHTGRTERMPVIDFLPRAFVDSSLSQLPLPEPVRQAFLDHETFAAMRIRRQLMHDVQVEALRQVDLAIADLVVESRLSQSRTPEGELLPWDRKQALFNPVRGDLILVHSIDSPRLWVQRTGLSANTYSINLAYEGLNAGRLEPADNLNDEQARLLCARASLHSLAPVERVTSLWQSIEFLLGAEKGEELFDAKAMRMLRYVTRRDIRKNLSDAQSARFDKLLGMLNDPSLLSKLRTFIERREIPVSAREFQLLRQLRKYRNDVNHGHEPTPPDEDTIDYGVAILARLVSSRST